MQSETSDMSTINLTGALARFVVDLRRERVPHDQVACVGTSMLDWLGCCIAGVHEPSVQALDAVLDLMGGAPQATLIARGRRSSVLNAVLLNGAAGNLLDLDDLHAGMIGHPSAVLAPTVLAIGDWLNLDWQLAATGYVAGYEVMARLGLGVEPELYNRGWHATGVLGVFGACAAAGKLLGLGETQLTSAFAIAASQAAGLRELFGTPSRCIHQGKAAMAGVLACLWAREGVQSCSDIIGGRHGLRVLSGIVRPGPILDGLGEHFLLSQTSYKRHAASGSLHAGIDATMSLREANRLSPADIEKVEVSTHPLALDLCGAHADPKSAFAAKQSMHFAVALALKEGRCDLDLYTDAMVGDPVIRGLRERISVSADSTMTYVEAMPSLVTITTRDGRRLSQRVDVPKGRPGNPMRPDEIAAKFRALCASVLAPVAIEEVIRSLAQVDGIGVTRLMQLVADAHPGQARVSARVSAVLQPTGA